MTDDEMAEDVCRVCGLHLGYGVRWLHLGICEECRISEAVREWRPPGARDAQSRPLLVRPPNNKPQ